MEAKGVRLTCTIVGSCFEPSLNSSKVSLESLFRSMIRKILSTRWGQLSSRRMNDGTEVGDGVGCYRSTGGGTERNGK